MAMLVSLVRIQCTTALLLGLLHMEAASCIYD